MRGRPGPRFASGRDTGVDSDLSGDLLVYWRFLMPFVGCFRGERSFVFWTPDAKATSLKALGAVAGAGVSVILGVLGVDFWGRYFSDEPIAEGGKVDFNDNDDDFRAAM